MKTIPASDLLVANTGLRSSRIRRCVGAVAALALLGLACIPAHAQIPPDVANQLRNVAGNRIEAMTILGGDFGVSGGTFSGDNGLEITINKFGGMGDVGDPRPLGWGDLKWQPRLQGSLGQITTKRDLNAGLLAGDSTEDATFAIQFGGGARFWFNDHISFTPTISAMYGHTENDYTARSAFGQANYAAAKQAGLIDWDVDTWTVRPGLEGSYLWTWKRVVFEATSDFAHFHTEDFNGSSSHLSIDGNSQTWENKIDVDIPLGKELFGHELHTGGFFSRTEFYGDLKDGLGTSHLYETHGRIVLDLLGKFWKVKWIGLGGSYMWGSNFNGWSVGADVAFQF